MGLTIGVIWCSDSDSKLCFCCIFFGFTHILALLLFCFILMKNSLLGTGSVYVKFIGYKLRVLYHCHFCNCIVNDFTFLVPVVMPKPKLKKNFV
jgi:hypothetical protein